MVAGLKVEDRLEGALNFTSWKVRVLLALEKLELLQFVEDMDLTKPSDLEELKKFNKNTLKAKKFLIDSVKDHLVPITSKLKIAREMFKHLEGIYEINNISQTLTLRQQLLQVKMCKGDSGMSFFMNISELKDQLSAIGSEVVDKDIIMIALNGLPYSWDPFIQSISGRDEFPSFDRLWSDCIQEESRLATREMHKGSHGGDQHVLHLNMLEERDAIGRRTTSKEMETSDLLLLI